MRVVLLAPVLALSLLLLTLLPARAQESVPVSPAPGASTIPAGVTLHPQLQKEVDKGAEAHYIGTFEGVDGWVMKKGDEIRYIYTTPDGGGFISGILFDADGQSITARQLQDFLIAQKDGEQIAYQGGAQNTASSVQSLMQDIETANTAPSGPVKTEPSLADQLYAAVESTHWTSVGDRTAPHIYVFVDAECSYCHTYWKAAKPFIDDGLVQMRMIPVARSTTGVLKSAALLASATPVQTWEAQMKGAVAPNIGKDAPQIKAIEENMAVMYAWNLRGIPYTVYRAADGVVKLIYDPPQNMMQVLSDLQFAK